MAKRKKVSSMQGSAAQTTHSAGTFLATKYRVAQLPPSYKSPHFKFGTYRHLSKLSPVQQSPGVKRYITKYPRSRAAR